MRNKLFRVVSPTEWGLIIDARLEKKANKMTRKESQVDPINKMEKPFEDFDFENKRYHGAYADDEKDELCDHIEMSMGTCIGCGRRSDDL